MGSNTIQGVVADGRVIPARIDADGYLQVNSINSSLLIQVGTLSLAAGTNVFQLCTVPAGLFYHFGTFANYYLGTVTNVALQLFIVRSAVNYIIHSRYNITSGQWQAFVIDILLMPGDVLNYQVLSATLNDDSYCNINGYSCHSG